MSEDATRFLDNIVDGECWVYGNVFLNRSVSKERVIVLRRVVKDVVCASLFGVDMGKYKGQRDGILRRGIGSLILDLRRWGAGNEGIYGMIIKARDEYLMRNRMQDYVSVLFRKKGCWVYEAVEKSLVDYLKEVA